jgi:hypothetical protein
MGPFGLGNGTFNSDVIDLSVVILVMSLGIEIGIGTSGDCEDCVVGGKCVGLLWRLLDLRWWLRWRVGFGFDLGICVVWHWVSDLWYHWRVCDLWSWRRLRMIGCGIVI